MTWSYSKISVFEKCPAQYDYKYNQKLPQPKSEAMGRGIKLHDKCEQYLKGKLKRVPKDVERIGPQLKRLKGYEACAEEWWNFKENWQYSDSSFQWAVAKVDAYCFPQEGVIEVTDFKTGKLYSTHNEQLHLYATMGLSMFECEKVVARADYIDIDKKLMLEWNLKDLPIMQNIWNSRSKRMLKAKVFLKKPGFYCRWCPYHRNNDGPCDG